MSAQETKWLLNPSRSQSTHRDLVTRQSCQAFPGLWLLPGTPPAAEGTGRGHGSDLLTAARRRPAVMTCLGWEQKRTSTGTGKLDFSQLRPCFRLTITIGYSSPESDWKSHGNHPNSHLPLHWAEQCSPRIHIHPEPRNVTLFGNVTLFHS